MAFAGTTASALTVAPGSTAGIQITGGYTVVGGGSITAGSTLQVTQTTVPFTGLVDPFVSGLSSTGSVDFEGLSFGDLTSGFVGQTFTVDLGTAPTFAFDVIAGSPPFVDESVLAVSKVNTTSTSIPSSPGDDTKIEGFATLGGEDASWSFSISGDGESGNFTFFVAVPPDLDPVNPIPLPAGAWLLLSGLGAAAFVRRKRA